MELIVNGAQRYKPKYLKFIILLERDLFFNTCLGLITMPHAFDFWILSTKDLFIDAF